MSPEFCPKLHANVHISLKLCCLRQLTSKNRENGPFELCPDFTGVEQYFRNDENAMESFILSPCRLT